MTFSRRNFLRSSTAAAASIALPLSTALRVLGANDEIRVGVVGLGVRGGGEHIPRMQNQKGVRVAAICDPDQTRLAAAAAKVKEKYGHSPETFVDIRKMLDRKDLDVISIATMQYWHALATLWACQAGKHVYVEKPLSHFIWEGRQMVNAARKYNRLVQVGTQSRSNETVRETMQFIRSGHLGKIHYITCFANKLRTPIGKRKDPLPIPETLDYELWCGPARKEPIYRDRLQYDCSFTWNMGDGESCNQGVHEIDVARWLLGETGLPRRVMSIGGRFVFNDAGDVPNTQIIYYDFPTAPVLYEVHNLPAARGYRRTDRPISAAQGRRVRPLRGRLRHDARRPGLRQPGEEDQAFTGGETISRTSSRPSAAAREDLHAEVLEGHLSTAICHAGNISYRLGQSASIDQIGRRSATPAWKCSTALAHLKAHEVDPDEAFARARGWNPTAEHECFQGRMPEPTGSSEGSYREPFVMPEVTA